MRITRNSDPMHKRSHHILFMGYTLYPISIVCVFYPFSCRRDSKKVVYTSPYDHLFRFTGNRSPVIVHRAGRQGTVRSYLMGGFQGRGSRRKGYLRSLSFPQVIPEIGTDTQGRSLRQQLGRRSSGFFRTRQDHRHAQVRLAETQSDHSGVFRYDTFHRSCRASCQHSASQQPQIYLYAIPFHMIPYLKVPLLLLLSPSSR